MSLTSNKLTNQQLIENISIDFLFPASYENNNQQFHVSSGVVSNLSEYIKAVENFIDGIVKTKELPFFFDKNIQGTTFKIRNKLGDLFYDLIKQQNSDSINGNFFRIHYGFLENYTMSEAIELLNVIDQEMNIFKVNFSFDPMTPIIQNGLIEGELINSFICRIGEAIKRKSFKNKLTQRKKVSNQNFNISKRYVERLYTYYPNLYAMRMVIGYNQQYANSINLFASI